MIQGSFDHMPVRGRVEEFPTLLCCPAWSRPGGEQQVILPGLPGDYRVEPIHPEWFVVWGPGDARVYSGPGPVEVVRSPAPF